MKRLRALVGFWLVLLASALYAGVSAWTSIRRLLSLQVVGWDITNITQTIWNTAHATPFAMTNLYPLTNRLGSHVEPLVLLLAPLAWIVGDAPNLAIGLLVIQAIVVASGAMPVYLLAKGMLKSEYGAVAFSILYLLYPAVGAVLSFEFHLIVLATGLWLWAIYCFHRQKWLGVVVFSLLATACKENLPLILVTFGVYLALSRQRHRTLGIGLALTGSVWFVGGVFWLQPHFSPTGENIQMRNYAWMGDTFYEKATVFLRDPQEVWLRLSYNRRLQQYMWELLAPWGFTSVLSPLQFLLTLPEMLVNLLSDKRQQGQVEDIHYASALIPFVTWSALLGTAWLLKKIRLTLEKRGRGPWVDYIALILFTGLLGWSFVYHYYRGYSPLSRAFSKVCVDSHAMRVKEFSSLVPVSAPILVQPNLGPFFAQRREVYSDFRALPKASFLLLDAATLLEIEGLHQDAFAFINTNKEFGVVKAANGYVLLQRGASRLPLPNEFFDFARAPGTNIQYPVQVRFEDTLEFLGYDLDLYRDGEPTFYLYFRLLNTLDSRYHIALYLLDREGKLKGGSVEESPVMVWYPMERWQVGEIVKLRYHAVPWNTRSMQAFDYALGILSKPDPWDVTARLRPTIVESDWQSWLPADGTLLGFARLHKVWGINEGSPSLRLTSLPRGVTGLHVTMAEGVSLAGVELSSETRAGETLPVILYWQSGGPTTTRYTAFVHLVNAAGTLVAQSDSAPGNGSLPSTFWTPGEVIPDPHSISLPVDIPPGMYTILAGLYDPTSGRRLLVMDSGADIRDNAIVIEKMQIR